MIGYLDLPSGLSGDMFLGCLVDAGWAVEELRRTIARLNLPAAEWSIDAAEVMKGPLRATLVRVHAAEGHHHRHLADIRAIIESSDLSAAVKAHAVAVFVRLAEAEAKVHGTTPDKIHFHEVGAVDAIIDIVGVAAGLHALGVETLYASAPPLGDGWVQTAHGQLPVPAPATLLLLAAVHAPIASPGSPGLIPSPAAGSAGGNLGEGGVRASSHGHAHTHAHDPMESTAAVGELLTPTGAALLAEFAQFTRPEMELHRIGTGAGRRNYPWPNIARLWLGRPLAAGSASPSAASSGGLVQLETNIDDMNPQLFAAVGEALFAAGARDVWLTPVQMKKGRPAVVLSVLAPAALEAALCDILFRQTTTLGIRSLPLAHRHEARREQRQVETPFGAIGIKVKWVGEDLVGATPEYEDCRSAAAAAAVPVKDVYDHALGAALALVHAHRPLPGAAVPPLPPSGGEGEGRGEGSLSCPPVHAHPHNQSHGHSHCATNPPGATP